MGLKAGEGPFWKTGVDPVTAVSSVLVLALAFFLLRFVARRRRRKEQGWDRLRALSQAKHLMPNEQSVLRQFFDGLLLPDVARILREKREFYNDLFEYLLRATIRQPELKVSILCKLFLNLPPAEQVEGPEDLHPGEICLLSFREVAYLGRVSRVKFPRVLLSLPQRGRGPTVPAAGDAASLYVYRPGRGGFTLAGQLPEVGAEGVLFEWSGTVQAPERPHMMARLPLHFVLSPWPKLDELALHAGESPPVASPGPGPDARPVAGLDSRSKIYGLTDHVSDRGFTFRLRTDVVFEFEPRLLKSQSLWEVNCKLPDDFVLSCHGRIVSLPARSDRYLFRFEDLPPTAEGVLRYLIQQKGAVPEAFA